MAKIHGLAYLMIGIMISVLSYYIDNNIKKGFSLFIYVGLLMMIIGVIRLAAIWVKNKKEKEAKQPMRQHARIHAPQNAPRHTYNQLAYCSRCGADLNPSDNFCYNCGNRLIHHRR